MVPAASGASPAGGLRAFTDSAAVTATTAAVSGCTATYHLDADWGSGFTATVTVGNTGTTAIRFWKVTWTWAGNQKVTSAWDTTATQSGPSVTAVSMSYNGTVAAGRSTSFGFLGSNSGADSAPALSCTAG